MQIGSVSGAVCWVAAVGIAAGAGIGAAAQDEGYGESTAAMAQAYLRAGRTPGMSVEHLGETAGGKQISVFTLAAGNGNPDERPGVLLVAGLDGRHHIGREIVLRMMDEIADDEGLLNEVTIYAIALANPDGAAFAHTDEVILPAAKLGARTNLTPVDEDRDGRVDEDPPRDLNGDGWITQMRRLDPPLDDPPTHMADPAEPRLLKDRDALKGERSMYTVYTEGVDADEDGLIAEDGIGGVDVNRNFPQRWPQFDRDAGAYPLSSAEAKAIAQFVIAHENIAIAVVYGVHDNIVDPPDGKGKDETGQGPRNVDSEDAKLYKKLSEVYTETTGHTRAAKTDDSGSLSAWLYAQRGIPTIATQVWGRPDPLKKDKKGEEDAKADDEADSDDSPAGGDGVAADPITGAWTISLQVPEMGEMQVMMELVNVNGEVTGTLTSPMGNSATTGSFSNEALTLGAEMGPGANVTMEFVLLDDGSLSGSVTPPDGDAIEMTAVRTGVDEAEVDQNADKKKGKKDDGPADADAAAWLKYSDEQRGGAGFVEWEPFDHPTLGDVEIGGFVQGFMMNPPAEEIDEIMERQVAFVREMIERRPVLSVEGPVVKELASGLYDVRFAIVNEGFLPTKTAQAAKSRATLPTVIRLSTPVERIVSGDRVQRAWTIEGSGGRFSSHWIVREQPGAAMSIEIVNSALPVERVAFDAVSNE